jgi:hypothetical protein
MASPGPTVADRWPTLLPTEEQFPDRFDRRDAARELGCFRHEAAAAAPKLTAMLAADPDPEVRGAAATALARVAFDAENVLPVLVEACGSDDPDLRSGAARGLGVLGSAAGAPTLTRLVREDPQPKVRAAAASALVDIVRDPDGAAKLQVDVPDVLRRTLEVRNDLVRIAVLGAMARLPRPPSDLPTLILAELYEEHPVYALSLIASLGPAGRFAAREIEKALEHPDPTVRARAIGCLTAVGWSGFGSMLQDASPVVRAAAADGLRQLGRRSLTATTAQLERAARVESDPTARAAIDAAWETLDDIRCSDEWLARLEVEARRPEVVAGQSRPVVPSESHLEQLRGIVSILGTPDGRLKVELASDVFLRTLAGQEDEDGPWFIVYQEVCGDFLVANTRRSELRGRPDDELAAFVESANPGWREHLAEHPEQPYGMPARRADESQPAPHSPEPPPS